MIQSWPESLGQLCIIRPRVVGFWVERLNREPRVSDVLRATILYPTVTCVLFTGCVCLKAMGNFQDFR